MALRKKKAEVSADEVGRAVCEAAGHELASATSRIKHCLCQLTDQQIWWRPTEAHNAIGNLILHLCGNLRQWIVAGLSGREDTRHRPAEFSERGPVPKAQLVAMLEATAAEAQAVLATVSPAEMLRVRRIQGFDVTGAAAIFDSIPHYRGHTQEIVHMARHLLGAQYQFAWRPITAEQGAEESPEASGDGRGGLLI